MDNKVNVNLRFNDIQSFVGTLRELKNRGLLSQLPNDIILDEDMFPMDIPLDVTNLVNLASNPMVRRAFGKKMDDTLMTHIARFIRAQA